jgi:hypothetical protein
MGQSVDELNLLGIYGNKNVDYFSRSDSTTLPYVFIFDISTHN